MGWTDLHGQLLADSFGSVLGVSQPGAVGFVRCLTPKVVEALASDASFAPEGWQVLRVADKEHHEGRTITADRAVELREAKGDALILLVDTELAGAGMDGIYSAARELDEATLFDKALRVAGNEITRRCSAANRRYANQAIKKARGHGGRYTLSRWTEFDFLCQVALGAKPPGAYLHLLGLWPIDHVDGSLVSDDLNTSRLFVDQLLGSTAASSPPAMRIEALRLEQTSEIANLERFLHSVDTKPLKVALEKLAGNERLWIGNLRIEQPAHSIQGAELIPWRNQRGAIYKWSGLVDGDDADNPPAFVLRRDADQSGLFSTLEVRWKSDPPHLEKNAVQYRVIVRTDQDEDLAVRDIAHSARKSGEKCRFSNDDFSLLDEDSLLSAKVAVEVVGSADIPRQETEEFVIRFGEPPKHETGGVGTKVRTFSEGLSDLWSREVVSTISSSLPASTSIDSKGFILLRTPVEQGKRKTFRVFRPSLIAEVEKQWVEKDGAIGRWIVKVRGSGERAGDARFEPIDGSGVEGWMRAVAASRGLAVRFAEVGGVGQMYDEMAGGFGVIQEYLRAWASLLTSGGPSLALVNTVEVQFLSERTIGLIVLPAHPLRVAWHTAYDNLVLHTAFEQEQSAKDIRAEFASLDGAMFPTFLPNLHGGTFVFADTLGFHAVGMVPDKDKEPKAAVAVLARALEGGKAVDPASTVGGQSARVLSDEIVKYLDCHDTSRLLHIHALRAGDGLTVARSLGGVHKRYEQEQEGEDAEEHSDEESAVKAPVFSLDLYPSKDQRDIAGRFISEAREKRRSGAGALAVEDRWMLESLGFPGGINMPRLRWARKEPGDPETAAHLAIAFDTFESEVVVEEDNAECLPEPYHAFGLLSFYERWYTSLPSPVWVSTNSLASEGEKHPSRRTHTEMLVRLQNAVRQVVSRHLGADKGFPALKTEISPEKADSLKSLHQLCDWVITLDRNAGIEYFDSPRDNHTIYDAYVIDCVPEREDLGCLQLITSTANIDEVRNLLDIALDQMGLVRSRRNTEFLMEHLKSLSGRLAIRLTGHRPPTSELVALAISHANCGQSLGDDDCWVSLKDGFVVPVDDVGDLLPPLEEGKGENNRAPRPELIYVSLEPRKGLIFHFIEVRYRRHLREARSPDVLGQIDRRLHSLRERWNQWYGNADLCASFRSVRRAKLARVLRFYVDKARRHHLSAERHRELTGEINRMVKRGGDYSFPSLSGGDRGWVFCPEYAGHRPLSISPDNADMPIFLFGPSLLPDSDIDSVKQTHEGSESVVRLEGSSQSSGDEPAPRQKKDAEGSADSTDTAPSNDDRLAPSMHLGKDTRTNAGIDWRLQVRGNPHLLIAGLPGMGKTTCLVNLCKQMVSANIRPIIFSYHQDIDELLQESIKNIRFVDFDGLGFNPLWVVDRNARMAHLDVAGAVRDIFTAIYPELGDIQADRIRKAIKESFEEMGWRAGGAIGPEPPFKRFVEILRADANPDRGLRTLLARLGELDDYGFFDVGDQTRGNLWESEQPTVVRIHTTQNDNLQRAFSCLVFYGLYKDMFRRGLQNRITHALIFDEAHRAARLKLIPTMAKECRKYGISLVLASQETRDFDVSVFSAIANYLVLRSTDADAKFLVRNVSNSKHERMLIDRIKQMEKFKALYFAEGKGQPSHVALSE